MSQSPYLNIAVRAASRAGEIMRRELVRLHDLTVTEKAPNDFVSDVDLACEATIKRTVLDMYPEHCFIGEEGGTEGNRDSDYRWIVDPLDGTSNYLHGLPHFCVSIAVEIRGKLEHAVIYDPIREEMFTASRGDGALLNGRRIRCSKRTKLKNTLIGTGFPFRKRRFMPAYQAMFTDFFDQCEDLRRAGSAALDLAYVAAGRLDGFFEIGLQPWDMAAGVLIVREAGGVVVDFAGADQYMETGNVVAGPFKLLPEMLKVIKPHQVTGINQ